MGRYYFWQIVNTLMLSTDRKFKFLFTIYTYIERSYLIYFIQKHVTNLLEVNIFQVLNDYA
jgi:hypothetical protein